MQELFDGCRRGRPSAQKAFYERFARPMFGVCRRYLRSDAEAEEILHNAFLKWFDAAPRFRWTGEAAAVSFLKRIFVNECLMHLRKQQSFLQVGIEEAAVLSIDDDPLDGLSASEIYARILALPMGYRTVFNLFVVEGLSHAEISAALGISEGTSKSQLAKAKALLRQQITQANNVHAFRKTN